MDISQLVVNYSMKKLTELASLHSLAKVKFVICSLLNLSDLRKCISIIADTQERVIRFRLIEYSFKNMMFLITIDTIMKAYPYVVTYPMESDDVK
jgi:hypothetical protein